MKYLIIGNWKSNPTTLSEAKKIFNLIEKGIKNIRNLEIVICPPFPFILSFKFKISNIKLGGQNCFWEEKGSFTGEVLAKQLKFLGCDYVVIGHSERRKFLNETSEQINKKIKLSIKAGLYPVFCIGESREEKIKGETEKVLIYQIEQGLKGIKNNDVSKVIIAYEPVWAIGSGDSCLKSDLEYIVLFLRKFITDKYSFAISKKISIIYGGSVNSKNIKDFINMSGVLVGGASLNPKEFINIINERINQKNN